MIRLGIFCFYEKKGVVRDYILFLLDDMIKNLDRLIVICNGELNAAGWEKFRYFTEEIFIRENKGFDVSAYREILIHRLTWNEIEKYDELILFNDTFYGPFYPMEEVFDEMSGKMIDFWGINRQFDMVDDWNKCEYGYIPGHISSYFMVFRKAVLLSSGFRDYWETLPSMEFVEDVICKHEVIFTRFLEDLGFRWDTYVNLDKYRLLGIENSNYLYMKSYDLIKKKQMPFIKRKALGQTAGLQFYRGKSLQARKVIKYIENKELYNMDYLWDDLLAKENIYDIYESLHLDYIVSENVIYQETYKKKAMFWHIEKAEVIDVCIDIINKILQFMDIYVLIESREKEVEVELEKYKKIGLNVIINSIEIEKLNWLYQLKNKIADYDLVCIFDKREFPKSKIEQESEIEEILSNLSANQAYINNINKIFKNEKRLGCLLLPEEYRNIESLMGNLAGLWSNDEEYQKSISWLKQKGVNVKCERNDKLFFNAMTGWFRADVLKYLVEDLETVPQNICLQKIVPYLIQNKGYYIGKIYNKLYAEAQLSQVYFMKRLDGGTKNRIEEFCRQNESLVIYGAGVYAKKYAEYLDELNIEYYAFVVTDYKDNPRELFGKPVIILNQLDKKYGILLGLNKENQKEVLLKLLREGYENVFWE